MPIDPTDRQLLTLLTENARAPVAELGRKLGLSRTTVQSRIERLERRGVIAGYTARLSEDYEKGQVKAHVLITALPKLAARVEAELRRIPEIRTLHSVSGQFDMTFPTDVTVPLLGDILKDAPQAQCTMRTTGVTTNLIVNRDVAPFDDARIRRAMALNLDRQAFIDILSEGKAKMGGTMLPPPEGVWGLPPEMLATIIGYGDVGKNRDEARALMKQAGFGPDKRLKIKVSTRNIAPFRDPAVILIDQLTKVLILRSFQLGDVHPVTSFFDIVRAHNFGAAFSFLHGASGWQRWFFLGLGLAAAAFIVWMLRSHGGQRMFSWALALILGGALGNVVDRLLHGYVVDFIQVHYGGWYFPSFNIADSAITVGAALLILDEILRVRRS